MAGVYIHIPYCGKLCSYCDFHFAVFTQSKERMINAIASEIDISKDFFVDKKISTIYFGGGTPSFCTYLELKIIVDKLKKYIDFKDVVEFTLEANPEDLTLEYLNDIKKLGVNRLSIGVQSFDNKVLQFFNRRHDANRAIEAVKNAQKSGFKNITIDLIYGVNGFEQEVWEKSIEIALSLSVQHISAYHLTINKGSVLGHRLMKGEISQIDDVKSQSQFKHLHTTLSDAGYSHYEVSNFALNGFCGIHNSNYWKSVEYAGFGPSAHSYNSDSREWNISNNRRYIESIESGKRAVENEKLSLIDKYNEYVMISLRTAAGIDINHIKSRFPKALYDYFCKQADKNKMIKKETDRYYIEPKDFLLSDLIITELIYTQ